MSRVRWGGMLASVFVAAAVVLGLLSVSGLWGLSARQIAGLLWPVLLWTIIFVVAAIAFGYWTLRLLRKDD